MGSGIAVDVLSNRIDELFVREVEAQPLMQMRCELAFSLVGVREQTLHTAQGLPLWTDQSETHC